MRPAASCRLGSCSSTVHSAEGTDLLPHSQTEDQGTSPCRSAHRSEGTDPLHRSQTWDQRPSPPGHGTPSTTGSAWNLEGHSVPNATGSAWNLEGSAWALESAWQLHGNIEGIIHDGMVPHTRSIAGPSQSLLVHTKSQC
jgi:hypothetical protein